MNARTWWRSSHFLFFILVGSSAAVLAAENAAKSAKQSDDLVREALQREVYGLDGDRGQLLSTVLSNSPDHAAARWHQGYVRSATGEWVKANDQSNNKRQALLKGYDNLRSTYSNESVLHQMELADWCAKQGLREQERVHLLRVCELSPDHPAARQRLNFARVGNEWVGRDELNKTQALQISAQKALVEWTPVVNKIAALLAAKDLKKRELGKEQLKQIHDPAALPALQSVLGSRDEESELLLVETAARMDDPAATLALARHAVFSPALFVRHTAATKLKAREREDYVPMLISSMFTPVITRLAEVALPNGRMGYRHEFLREGSERQELLVLDTQYRRLTAPGSTPIQARALAATEAQQTAARLERAVAEQNAATNALNDRIAWVLNTATEEKLPASPENWWSWWNEQNEVYVSGSKPVTTVSYSRSVTVVDSVASGGTMDCLKAGTPVWTEQGQVAIEKVRAGDLVLSRDIESGELAYKPVLRTTVRPASPLVKIQAGTETFETSGGHLFWVSGEGWVKSRKLESGMVLHTASGPARDTGQRSAGRSDLQPRRGRLQHLLRGPAAGVVARQHCSPCDELCRSRFEAGVTLRRTEQCSIRHCEGLPRSEYTHSSWTEHCSVLRSIGLH